MLTLATSNVFSLDQARSNLVDAAMEIWILKTRMTDPAIQPAELTDLQRTEKNLVAALETCKFLELGAEFYQTRDDSTVSLKYQQHNVLLAFIDLMDQIGPRGDYLLRQIKEGLPGLKQAITDLLHLEPVNIPKLGEALLIYKKFWAALQA